MKVNKKILLAIQDYFYHCSRQWNVKYSHEAKSGYMAERSKFVWNKDADLNKIAELCKKQGFGFTACADTFWFQYKTKHGNYFTLKTDEDLFPNFEKSKD